MSVKSVAALLALGLLAHMAVTVQADAVDELFQVWQAADAPGTVAQQRSLLQSSPAGSPRYSPTPSPVYSPRASPIPSPVYSPAASPRASPSPVASPRPAASPRPCKFSTTANFNIYTLVIRSTRNWGAGRDAIVAATAAVYKRYSQPASRYFVTVTGAPGQVPEKPTNDFTYTIRVPVTPCVGFKEGMRAALRTAVKRVSGRGISKTFFGIRQ